MTEKIKDILALMGFITAIVIYVLMANWYCQDQHIIDSVGVMNMTGGTSSW